MIEVLGLTAPLQIDWLVSDFNGTLAVDGRLGAGVAERLQRLKTHVQVTVVTSDTYGTARAALGPLGIDVHVLEGEAGPAKRRFVESVGAARCAAIGNGMNDVLMLEAAVLAIVVLGDEGAAGPALQHADLVVPSPAAALDLLLNPARLHAGLRP